MAKLVYAMLGSVDGYTADTEGSFDWAEPDEEVHAFANELERPIGTHLYGRRMYETMVFWANPPGGMPGYIAEYASIWQTADNVVYSTTLTEVSSPRTRIEPVFDVDAVRAMKESADRDISIGGPQLAAQALKAGLVDEIMLFAVPVVVGGGTRVLPDGIAAKLELLDERRFTDGTVFTRYAVSG